MSKRAVLIVGLALMIAAAGVAYSLWTDTLVMNVNVATGTIDPQWSLAGTNDDGVNDGWDGEQVLSTVYTYGAATSSDPSGIPAGAVTHVVSAALNYSDGGWGGWSCPAGTMAIAGGVVESVTPYALGLAKPGAVIGGFTYPTFPHYVYNPPEEGVVATMPGGTWHLWVDCQGGPLITPRYDKDVADCFATGNGTDTLTVNITNAYPSYWCTVKADLHNDGSVPVKLQSISITGGDPAVLDVVMPSFACGHQLDPGARLDFFGSFHPKNPVNQNANYTLSYTLNWVNYNEFAQGSCSGF